MITNNGKLLCNDCGKPFEKIGGITFGVSADGDHYCIRHYREHFGPTALEALDRKHIAAFKKLFGIPDDEPSAAIYTEFPYLKKPPKLLAAEVGQ
ncbi:hypothetical protein [Rhodococcus sp. AQ5-07]|uniref:hypothetical protein n=1 Tax=Rhodococcus sp. AQ5-07 TaxID=2054902 RepID=UPI000DBF84CA|nr:hypothetical protein [Rhodococcus sp. AQ5-07]RAL31499.1 hypothetical protein CVN56_27755 [Rhodococcus sp. AQ5-07]